MLRKVLIGVLFLIITPITTLASDQTTNLGPKEGKYMCTTDRAAGVGLGYNFLGLSTLNQNQLRFSITLRKAYQHMDKCFSSDTTKWLKEYQPPVFSGTESQSERINKYFATLDQCAKTPGCGPWEDPGDFISYCLANFKIEVSNFIMDLDSLDGRNFFR